jgi:hypothetical protein
LGSEYLDWFNVVGGIGIGNRSGIVVYIGIRDGVAVSV